MSLKPSWWPVAGTKAPKGGCGGPIATVRKPFRSPGRSGVYVHPLLVEEKRAARADDLPGEAVLAAPGDPAGRQRAQSPAGKSEEHTSELQSLMRTSYAGLCLKNKNN